MNPYQFINTNNNSLGDLSYNPQAKKLIDSLMSNFSVTPTNQGIDENGYDTTQYQINGFEGSKIGDNKYSIGVDDPTSRGLFDINVQVDPETGKLTNLGTQYRSRGSQGFNFYAPLAFAAMAVAPELAPELFGAMEGGAVAGDAFLPGLLATDPVVASGIAADVAAQTAGVGGAALGAETAGAGGASGIGATGGGTTSGASLGSGTAYSADAATNPLNPFYGTAQTSPTSLTLASGGGGSTMGEGSIIGSGAGLGQTTPASAFSMSDALKIPNPSQSAKKPIGSNVANALRIPLNTSVSLYHQKNPFYFAPQQQSDNELLAKMLRV